MKMIVLSNKFALGTIQMNQIYTHLIILIYLSMNLQKKNYWIMWERKREKWCVFDDYDKSYKQN